MQNIYTIKNLAEASAIEAALKSEGIKFIIRTFDDKAYNGIFMLQKGYGEVLVGEKDVGSAKSIIEEIKKGFT